VVCGLDEMRWCKGQCSWEESTRVSTRVRCACRSICGERGEKVLERECVCARETGIHRSRGREREREGELEKERYACRSMCVCEREGERKGV